MQRYDVTATDGRFEISGWKEADSCDMALRELLRESSMSKGNILKATIMEYPWRHVGTIHSISESYKNRLKERTKCSDAQ